MIATIPAQEVKRRGMSALNEQLKDGPVWIIANNTPKYVVLFADDFRRMRHEAFVEGCLRSDAECRAGLAAPATVEGLMSAFDE
ncbi:MAG: prevent-host-death protein [Kiritimatiellae bacterium]|nr:prevent-host-death protein [Kiritimatiellia bacterium]